MKLSFILKLLTALSISGETFGPIFNFLGNSLKLVLFSKYYKQIRVVKFFFSP